MDEPPGWGPQARTPDPTKKGAYIVKNQVLEVTRAPRGKFDGVSPSFEPPAPLVRALTRLFDGNGGKDRPVHQAALRIDYARVNNYREGDVPGLELLEQQ
eukprot:s135_g20.t1